MILNKTTDNLTIELSSAITTNQLDCYSIVKINGVNEPKEFNTNGTNAIDVLTPPVMNNRPTELVYLNVFNRDTVTHTVSFKLNSTLIKKIELATNESFEYSGLNFTIYTQGGLIKQQSVSTVTNAVNTVILGANVINNNAVANTLQDVTGLSFTATSGIMYKFDFNIFYTSAIATTGSRWSINAPSFDLLTYTSEYTLTSGTSTRVPHLQAINLPATSNATSTLTNNFANIKGIIKTNSTGDVIARFASEVASSAITALAGSFVEYVQK